MIKFIHYKYKIVFFMKKGGSFFCGIILGTMAGLIMGIMLSKKKDDKMKNIIGEKTEELRNNLQDISNKIGEQVNKIKSNIEERWKKSKIKNDLNNIDQVEQVEDELGT
ncbi:YtxH domain-containing protein [Blattabacterium cuenoti]|uniref:YtxH domain-containing protein n=1 Tax=Blattabacterium cuenoti TaxID=1653831 RepID=UPI001EEC1B53|nr:YtxH domain-containing protein [Blattabacterium cuenoti]